MASESEILKRKSKYLELYQQHEIFHNRNKIISRSGIFPICCGVGSMFIYTITKQQYDDVLIAFFQGLGFGFIPTIYLGLDDIIGVQKMKSIIRSNNDLRAIYYTYYNTILRKSLIDWKDYLKAYYDKVNNELNTNDPAKTLTK